MFYLGNCGAGGFRTLDIMSSKKYIPVKNKNG
jgi:hypothetical protein